MATAPKFTQIPMPTADPQSMLRSLQAVISTLQMMTSQGPKSQSGAQTNRNMAHTFIQDNQPTAINPGDFWFCQNPKASLSCWDGTTWTLLVTAP
jgi:hypothetical protein